MKNLFVIFSLAILFFSCKKDNDDDFIYQGSWAGTYSGIDNGTWQASIGSDGKFTGTAASNFAPTFPFNINGTVSNSGAISARYSFFSTNGDFNGQITGNTVSGTWKADSSSFTGSWTGQRK